MPYKLLLVVVTLLAVRVPVFAQDTWSWGHRIEIRANYRWSDAEEFRLMFPPGAALRTADPGHHVELNVADLQLDLGYGNWLAARAKVHAQAKHRRNPTSEDRQIDADELWVRIGQKPEFLERPERTSFFVQAGKFPKMERQPVRLLESYGLAATAFNRFEDVQVLVGGTIGRNFYWRAQAANGNPLFIRDANALAGDNGTPASIGPPPALPNPEFGSGFPILYNAETEDLFFDTSKMQLGEALGYRWQREDETLGFDLIVFHYERDLADTVDLTGTLYGGDLDILRIGPADDPMLPDRGLPLQGRTKREYGARLYGEWNNATAILQYTRQTIAGLDREGWEVEAGYRIPLALGPVESIQPAVRASGITNDFGPVPGFPAPSIWWDWTKLDAGVRVGLERGFDVTFEYTKHNIGSAVTATNPRQPEQREALVTVRWRV
ncbi:MAG TPA: hypothetical protein VHK90_00655 [Thermoanaerobaculia bacterium]|nr:hypothetical protein [Thermoanaerobaculia bacterium]